ncbi:hypothetical protein WSK_3205 [Novosphingobium sp. Rr 2-17]|uniref:uracil-DNA glycosylase family protein n=1 Tax=Novosphingobium sp. Rr 2-17 TaxID=555793 RepID=UPI00026988BD|nr:uracil-DNA glycosylase family protein [Novosphingobium sp. Rr 2-17]EIZ78230.1 hypothetical protein WSK_3205 [Novosphingobium sp. Rr 2-17]
MSDTLDALLADIRVCRLCEAALPHKEPRPYLAVSATARLLIIGQAPGSKVHASGIGWDDDSGDRLRGWLGLDKTTFYDSARIAQMPSGFCYPGKGNGGDLPPRPECAPRWHASLLQEMPQLRLTLLVGQHAQKRYLPRGFASGMTQAVQRWREVPTSASLGQVFPLPHPAWRSRMWMARNPWFEAEVLPALQRRVRETIQL